MSKETYNITLNVDIEKQIIATCIEKVEKEGIASVKEIATRLEMSGADKEQRIAYKITSSGEYLQFHEHERGYLIVKNPNYETNKSIIATNNSQRRALCVTIGVSIASFIVAAIGLFKQEKNVVNVPATQIRTDTVRLQKTASDTFLIFSR